MTSPDGSLRAPATKSRSAVRPEIQALRALAVSAVVLFHLFPAALPGGYVGVDVFFVISGYLITAHLLRELDASGRLRLGAFYARRARRLLPAAFLVLAVTLVGVLLFVPTALWRDFLGEIAASAAYIENWVLAGKAVDYFGAETAASPVQHYWSLSVEEQFYLVWPLLIFAAAVVGARWMRSRPAIGVTLAVVTAASFVASVMLTASDPAGAYFSTFTHAWEFGLGGILALTEARILAAARGRADGALRVVGWAGFAAIVVSCFVFSGATPFPGSAALLPVVGAVAVILAGPLLLAGPGRALVAPRGVRWVGDASYSIYLWHWPLIVLVPFVIGRSVTVVEALVILVATLVLAEATRRLVEDPIRFSSRGRGRSGRVLLAALAGSVVLVAAGIVPVAVVQVRVDAAAESAREQVEEGADCFGAGALLDDRCDPGHTVGPVLDAAFAKTDGQSTAAQLESDGDLACSDIEGTVVNRCVFGDPTTQPTFAIVGDSHMAQYRPLLIELARAHGWAMLSFIQGACLPTLPLFAFEGDERFEMRAECQQWKAQMPDAVASSEASVVVTTSASRLVPGAHADSVGAVRDAFAQTWNGWRDAGKQVLVIGDTPAMRLGDIPDCVAAADSPVDPCTVPRVDAAPADPALLAAPSAGASVVDVVPAICDAELCHSVVGGVIVFHDAHHLTATFAATLRQSIEPALVARFEPGD